MNFNRLFRTGYTNNIRLYLFSQWRQRRMEMVFLRDVIARERERNESRHFHENSSSGFLKLFVVFLFFSFTTFLLVWFRAAKTSNGVTNRSPSIKL